MLSDNQINQLKVRVAQLRVELLELISDFGIESESSIDHELKYELSKKDTGKDSLDLIDGLKKA